MSTSSEKCTPGDGDVYFEEDGEGDGGGDGAGNGDGDVDGDVGGDGESCSQALVGHQPSSTQLLNSPNPDSNSCAKASNKHKPKILNNSICQISQIPGFL